MCKFIFSREIIRSKSTFCLFDIPNKISDNAGYQSFKLLLQRVVTFTSRMLDPLLSQKTF